MSRKPSISNVPVVAPGGPSGAPPTEAGSAAFAGANSRACPTARSRRAHSHRAGPSSRSGSEGRHPKRGTVYVLVLTAAAIATAAGLGGIYIQRTNLRAARAAADIDRARVLAASGLEYALARVNADANWRTTLGTSNWFNAVVGPGTMTVAVSDPVDADMVDSITDPILVSSTGTVGTASQTLAATIDMIQVPRTALACGSYARSSVALNVAAFTSDGPIATGGNMTAVLATVNADAEAVGTVAGMTYNRPQTSGATPRTFPPATIADTWAAMGGSTIPYASIPSRQLERILVAPSTTVLGAPQNATGLYVIDCGNSPLIIRDLRIYGTLIVLNCTDLRITGSVRIDPITAGYPSLIVEGPLTLGLSTSNLSEATINVNLNPASVPWAGTTNNNKTGTYPSGMTGIVLATSDVTVSNTFNLTGCLISLDDMTIGAATNVTTNPVLTTSPAPGFSTIVPTLAATGVRRTVN